MHKIKQNSIGGKIYTNIDDAIFKLLPAIHVQRFNTTSCPLKHFVFPCSLSWQ